VIAYHRLVPVDDQPAGRSLFLRAARL
jgi:hypothetical protein